MKKITFLAVLVATLSLTGFTQNKAATVSHKGFYLSLAMGPAFGDIKGSDNYGEHYTVKGTAYCFSTQIGGALKPNLILHGTIQIQSIFGPKINDTKLDNKYSFDENFIGAGITKYSSRNFFITANIGAAYYSITEETNNPFVSNETSTDPGFSFNVRVGQEWMISKKWGLGAVVFYGRTSLKTKDADITERWSSNRFGICFQATFSKAKG